MYSIAQNLFSIFFWTVYGAKSSIRSARLDGTSIKTVVKDEVVWPGAIVTDDGKIYWEDLFKKTIECTTYNGQQRQVIAVSTDSSGFDIFKGVLYYTQNLDNKRLVNQQFYSTISIIMICLKCNSYKTLYTGKKCNARIKRKFSSE